MVDSVNEFVQSLFKSYAIFYLILSCCLVISLRSSNICQAALKIMQMICFMVSEPPMVSRGSCSKFFFVVMRTGSVLVSTSYSQNSGVNNVLNHMAMES